MCHSAVSKRKPHKPDRQKEPGLGINQLTCHALQRTRPVSTTACLQPNITQSLALSPISPSSIAHTLTRFLLGVSSNA